MPFPEVNRSAPINAGAGAQAASPVEFVTAADFRQKVLEARGPVAVEFMSFGCGYCRKANPMVHDVAKALEGQVKVFQVNVPVSMDLARRYGIVGTPTFVMFKDGQELSRSNPELTPYAIRRAIMSPFEQ